MPRDPDKIDHTGGHPENLTCFHVIEALRREGATKHHFGDVLFMCVTGALVAGEIAPIPTPSATAG